VTYVATVSGEVMYDGRLEEITAGITYIADGHEIVRRYPRMFKKASGRMMSPRPSGSRVETRSRAANPAPAWRLPDPPRTAPTWRLPGGRPPRSTVEAFDWQRTAKHEAAHAAAAHLLGWNVAKIAVHDTGGGGTEIISPPDCSGTRRTHEAAVIARAAERYIGWTSHQAGYAVDRQFVRDALRMAPSSRDAHTYRVNLDSYVRDLVAQPRFKVIAKHVARALTEAGGTLSGEPLQRALRAGPWS
jgi:hypothetical protein